MNPPNILFLFPDQHRFDWTGGSPDLPALSTPHLDALAGRGMRFTRGATVASPLCAPSRACLAAGREYDRCGVPDNKHDYPPAQTTYYQLLRDRAGYHVAGAGKFDLAKAAHDQGIDGKRLLPEWGFSDGINNAGKWDAVNGFQRPRDPYMTFLHARGLAETHVQDMEGRRGPRAYTATDPTPLPDDAYCDNWIAGNGLRLLRAFPENRPWHLVVNFAGPHDPLDITHNMERGIRGRAYPPPAASTQYDQETHRRIRQNYGAMVENLDRWVGAFVDEVARRGDTGNTLVVYSSDHGEMLGDHDRWGKSQPYQPSVNVPLIVAGPGVARGAASDVLVSLIDLAATYLDYAGVHTPAGWDSRSLRPVLQGETGTHRTHVLSGLNPWRMVFDGRHKLVTGYGPKKETLLFDRASDPHEEDNLTGDPRFAGVKKDLARWLPDAADRAFPEWQSPSETWG